MTTHLCPVCAMPAPSGLVHCSLACEEKDGEDQPLIGPDGLAFIYAGQAPVLQPPAPAHVEGVIDAHD